MQEAHRQADPQSDQKAASVTIMLFISVITSVKIRFLRLAFSFYALTSIRAPYLHFLRPMLNPVVQCSVFELSNTKMARYLENCFPHLLEIGFLENLKNTVTPVISTIK